MGRDQEITDLLLLEGIGLSTSLKFVEVFVEARCNRAAECQLLEDCDSDSWVSFVLMLAAGFLTIMGAASP